MVTFSTLTRCNSLSFTGIEFSITDSKSAHVSDPYIILSVLVTDHKDQFAVILLSRPFEPYIIILSVLVTDHMVKMAEKVKLLQTGA